MNKTLVGTLLVVLLLALGGTVYFLKKDAAIATKEQKVYKIGVLNGYDFFGETVSGFKSKLSELGLVEGKDILYDVQKKNVDIQEYRSALEKFAADGVDLILTFPTEASIEGKHIAQTTGIPVVFANANVEGVDLINSIQEPGNNITGVRFPGPDIIIKRLEVMTELAPDAKNILVPYDRNYPNVPPQIEAVRTAAASLSVNIIEVPVSDPAEFQSRIDALVKEKQDIDAILVLAEPLSATPPYVEIMGKFAQEKKIPWGGTLILKKDGYSHDSIFGILVDPFSVGEQAALLAHKVLVNGISAGTIPVVSAESVLEINYTAAKAIGITPSEGLLSRAARVIR